MTDASTRCVPLARASRAPPRVTPSIPHHAPDQRVQCTLSWRNGHPSSWCSDRCFTHPHTAACACEVSSLIKLFSIHATGGAAQGAAHTKRTATTPVLAAAALAIAQATRRPGYPSLRRGCRMPTPVPSVPAPYTTTRPQGAPTLDRVVLIVRWQCAPSAPVPAQPRSGGRSSLRDP